MAFPSSPSDGQQITVGNVTYSYNASKTAWYRIGTVANPITSTVDYYTGDGVTDTFALSAIPTSENYTFAAVGGVLQPRDRYSVVGTSLTFSSAPPVNAPIDITTFGGSGASIYSNNSVSVYLPTSSVIIGINANVAAANAAIITANSAVVSYVNTLNSAMASNVAGANAAILLRANIASPTFTGTVTVANITTTNGLFWSNGTAFSSGSSGVSSARVYGLSVLFGTGY